MGAVERVLQAPCQWCGRAVRQPPTGRRLRYCGRSCRQRAYEVRTAQRRLQADVEAGTVRAEPAERVVERVVQPRYPKTAAGWEHALEELAQQLSDGRLAPWHADRVARALSRAATAARSAASGGPVSPARPSGALARQQSPAYGVPAVWEPIVRKVHEAGGVLSTTLQSLAAATRMPEHVLRVVLGQAQGSGVLTIRRHGEPARIHELASHGRFELSL